MDNTTNQNNLRVEELKKIFSDLAKEKIQPLYNEIYKLLSIACEEGENIGIEIGKLLNSNYNKGNYTFEEELKNIRYISEEEPKNVSHISEEKPKSIWHISEEEPLENKDILFEFENEDGVWYDTAYYNKERKGFFLLYNVYQNLYDTTRWAYIKDLVDL